MRTFAARHPDTRVVIHPHPRDEDPGRYARMAPRLSLIDPSKIKVADRLLPIADVVVSMYSTTLLHACSLRIPAVSILLRQGGRSRLRSIGLNDFPPNQTGASIGIYEPRGKMLIETLRKIKEDKRYRERIRGCQRKNFPAVRGTARDAVLAIRRFLN